MGRELFLSPIVEPRRVLDLGTGTGIWAIDFADKFPDAEVVGVDLSPTQPAFVPPNVKFIIDDIDEPWVDGEYDFIHGRYLFGCSRDFPKLFRECYRNAAPGAWVEFQEWETRPFSEDGSTDNTSIVHYYDLLNSEFSKIGRPVNIGPQLEGWMRDAGFEDVTVQKYLVPMGRWPKDKHLKTLGTWNWTQADTGFEAGAMAVLTRHAGWSKEEVQVLVSKTRNDARNPAIHALFNLFPHSNLHQRDPRASSSLFDAYNGASRPASRSPRPGGYGGYSGSISDGYTNGGAQSGLGGSGYRSATPNSKGQYSDAVLSSLESQNESEIEGISAKVKMLKDITVAIGDEIRTSSALADKMNESFDNTRVKLRGTMNRMLRMAERTGVGWRVWLLFFLAVFLLFAYVWLS
ncbi:protein transport protein bet1 [Paecilomyces lecythidis]|uniref:Protein transport protein bet1 n=1 Tax=Paecilomyces lecythidis TaxID=3004212 RepID=A0ABR3X0U6_9EURO